MSRIHDAMQRAAAERGVSPADTAVVHDGDFPHESSTVQDAEFPVESAAPLASNTPPISTDFLRPAAAGAINGSAAIRKAHTQPEVNRVQALERIAVRYDGKTLVNTDILPQSREEYRRLAASLHQAQAIRGTKVVMVTSAIVGEGKTVTASNVALTLSHSYQKQVLLIDADLRRPSIEAVFGLKPLAGLGDRLTASEDRPVPVQQVFPRLCILPAGRPTSDPIATLTSDRMRRLIGEAREMFDWVILDTPPVALLTDANLLSSMTDGAVIVVKAGETRWDLVDRAVQAIGRDRTLGIVLNRATVASQATGYYDKYYPYAAADK